MERRVVSPEFIEWVLGMFANQTTLNLSNSSSVTGVQQYAKYATYMNSSGGRTRRVKLGVPCHFHNNNLYLYFSHKMVLL